MGFVTPKTLTEQAPAVTDREDGKSLLAEFSPGVSIIEWNSWVDFVSSITNSTKGGTQ